MREIQPIGNRIIVKPILPPLLSKGGLYIPPPTTTFTSDSRAKVAITKGTVLAVGPGRLVNEIYIPVSVAVGQVVAFSDTAGRELEIDGEKIMFIREDDVVYFGEA